VVDLVELGARRSPPERRRADEMSRSATTISSTRGDASSVLTA
jgi:hypothetical protein